MKVKFVVCNIGLNLRIFLVTLIMVLAAARPAWADSAPVERILLSQISGSRSSLQWRITPDGAVEIDRVGCVRCRWHDPSEARLRAKPGVFDHLVALLDYDVFNRAATEPCILPKGYESALAVTQINVQRNGVNNERYILQECESAAQDEANALLKKATDIILAAEMNAYKDGSISGSGSDFRARQERLARPE